MNNGTEDEMVNLQETSKNELLSRSSENLLTDNNLKKGTVNEQVTMLNQGMQMASGVCLPATRDTPDPQITH